MSTLRRTPLHAAHEKLGARIIDFHGWQLPVQYSGIVAEHLAVRNSAGLFDVSHMGEFWIEGEDACEALQRLLTNDLAGVEIGRVQYTFLCNEEGGTIDDLTVLRTAETSYLLCVNASNTTVDWEWIRTRLPSGVRSRDSSEETALVALQGPRAEATLLPLVSTDLKSLRRFRCMETRVAGIPTLLSRTGYTGEDGFELFVRADSVLPVWDALVETGVQPCGLGARDTLRIEAGFPLHGQDLDPRTTPIEAGLERFVSMSKGDFIGREALARQAEDGVKRRRIGLKLESRAVPRAGYPILQHARKVGEISSGTFAPSLQSSIAMGYVDVDAITVDAELQVEIRGKAMAAQVCDLPFYTPRRR